MPPSGTFTVVARAGTLLKNLSAIDLVPDIKPGQLFTGIRPGVKLYYWLTYDDAQNKLSKPSPVHAEVTVDNFKEK